MTSHPSRTIGSARRVLRRVSRADDGRRRSKVGERDATARVQGIVAQKLPHVDLLLVEPWTVSLPRAGQDAIQVRIPNAVAYLAQKVLVLPDREKDKQSNDVVYVHDTLMMFADNLPALGQALGVGEGPARKKQVRDASRAIAALFGHVDDKIRRAAIIARETGRGAPPSAELIRARCHDGLQAISRAGNKEILASPRRANADQAGIEVSSDSRRVPSSTRAFRGQSSSPPPLVKRCLKNRSGESRNTLVSL